MSIASVVLVLFWANMLIAGAGPTEMFESLNEKVNALTYETRFAEAHEYIRNFFDDEELTPEERYYSDFLIGDVYRAAGQEHLALKHYDKAEEFLDVFGDNKYFEAILTLRRAECHFNRERYDIAYSYAKVVFDGGLQESLPFELRPVAKLILGYCSFKDERFDLALDYYKRAENNYISAGLRCELPLAVVKLAGLHLHTGRYDEMDAELRRAEALVDSCGILMYRVLLYRTKIHIYETLGDFREAYYLHKKLGRLHAEFKYEEQKNQIEALEAQIQGAEKERLKQTNARNAAVLREKQTTLNLALACVLLLGVLSFFLIRVNRQRISASQAIVKLNAELEAKVMERTDNLEKANRRITDHAEKLKEKNVQMLDFCNIISHNFRGPLANMVALTDLMDEAESAEERGAFAQHFKPVLHGLNETCNELFESLQVVQDPSVTEKPVAFSEAFDRTCRALQALIADSRARVTADFAEAPEVLCPQLYLESIFHNLISNAVKYRSPDRAPEIEVKSEPVDEEVVLSVKDNGVGLDLERHGKALFKMRRVFHDHPEAKGFGLFLTKAQVENVGGRIWAESTPGEGARFCVAFPKQNR